MVESKPQFLLIKVKHILNNFVLKIAQVQPTYIIIKIQGKMWNGDSKKWVEWRQQITIQEMGGVETAHKDIRNGWSGDGT